MFFALVLLVIVGAAVHPAFLTNRNITNILRQVSVIGIISMGMTVVIITGGIDLSVGSAVALYGVFTIWILNTTGSIFLAVIGGLVLGVVVGLVNGLLITKGQIAPFIATLGMMAVARSLALFFVHGGSIVSQTKGFMALSNTVFLGVRVPVFYFAAIVILFHILMSKTSFGRYVYAIGSNEKATHLSAINVNAVKMKVYILAGSLTAFAAVTEAATLNSISSASSGHSYEMDAIASVIIGGTALDGGRGRILGTLIGVLLLGVLNNILNLMNTSPFLTGFVKGVIIIVAVLLQKKNRN